MNHDSITVDCDMLGKELVRQLLNDPKDHAITLVKDGDQLVLIKRPPKQYLTYNEAASQLGISVPTFRRRYTGKHIQRKRFGFLRKEVNELKARVINGEL